MKTTSTLAHMKLGKRVRERWGELLERELRRICDGGEDDEE